MKNILLLYFLVAFTAVNAQKYMFNTLSKYVIPSNDPNANFNFTNSYNDTYFLSVRKYKSFIEAVLYDYENLKVHNFKVTESKINEEVTLMYEYESTSSLYYFNKKDYSKYVYDFQTIEENDSIRKVKLDVYRNSKKKKVIATYHLDIKKYNSNLFPIFRISCMHGFTFVNKLNSNENGLVISAKGNSLSGKVYEYKLTELKQVLFELNVPPKKKNN